MTVTTTGLPNSPTDPQIISSLSSVCENVLEKVRANFTRPVVIHSGYRSQAVNAAVGGAKGSQHTKGQAADFHVLGHSHLEVAEWIRDNIEFDQLILENYIGEKFASGWVHCSYAVELRGSVLTKFRGSKHYHKGLLKG
jgi:hypothetical protein